MGIRILITVLQGCNYPVVFSCVTCCDGRRNERVCQRCSSHPLYICILWYSISYIYQTSYIMSYNLYNIYSTEHFLLHHHLMPSAQSLCKLISNTWDVMGENRVYWWRWWWVSSGWWSNQRALCTQNCSVVWSLAHVNTVGALPACLATVVR